MWWWWMDSIIVILILARDRERPDFARQFSVVQASCFMIVILQWRRSQLQSSSSSSTSTVKIQYAMPQIQQCFKGCIWKLKRLDIWYDLGIFGNWLYLINLNQLNVYRWNCTGSPATTWRRSRCRPTPDSRWVVILIIAKYFIRQLIIDTIPRSKDALKIIEGFTFHVLSGTDFGGCRFVGFKTRILLDRLSWWGIYRRTSIVRGSWRVITWLLN